MFDLEKAIAGWKRNLRKQSRFEDGLIADLEIHLRETFEAGREEGLGEEDAFRAAVAQLGEIDAIAFEYDKNRRLGLDRRSPLRPSRLAAVLNEEYLESALRKMEKEQAGSRRYRRMRRLAMFLSYLKSALRGIRKNKGFYFINVFGFSLGMACFLLIMMFVRYELSYDDFHAGAERIYRVINTYTDKYTPGPKTVLSHSSLLADDLARQYPEIESAASLWSPFKASLKNKTDFFELAGPYADGNFFKVFSYPLISGSEATALSEPYSILITESVRSRLFGDKNPVGSTVAVSRYGAVRDFAVRGVLADPPINSHLNFDFIMSLETLRNEFPSYTDPGNWSFYVYMKLRRDQSPGAFAGKLSQYKKMMIPGMMISAELSLQPITDIHLKSHFQGELSANGDMKTVYLFSSIAVLIFLIAGINYTNLSVAKASTRTREIGVRKVLGANRPQIFKQFISESFLVSGAALALSVALLYVALPFFNILFERDIRLDFLRSADALGLMVLTLVLGGFFAGLYPAAYLSSFPPVQILKRTAHRIPRGGALRKVLVVFQFSNAMILVVCSIVILGQILFIRNKDLGFRKDNTLIVPLSDKSVQSSCEAFKSEVLRHPGVTGASLSSQTPLNIAAGIGRIKIKKENGENVAVDSLKVLFADEDFLNLYNIRVLKGRAFAKEFTADAQNGVIVNEAYVKMLGYEDPLGKTVDIKAWGIRDRRIVGVVADFHFVPLYQQIVPLVICPASSGPNISLLSVKLRPESVAGALKIIKEIYLINGSGAPFKYYFLDDTYARTYKKEQKLGSIFAGFTILALVISCLGLFGLALFTADKRAKEISLRKVMGATEKHILGMLSKEIVLLAVLSNLISWPISFYAINKWLGGFVYRIHFTVFPFVLAGLMVFAFAILTVLYQVVRAARTNPVDALRCE
jgi:putative ABC transport system permease protein